MVAAAASCVVVSRAIGAETNALPDAREIVRRSNDLLRDTNSFAVVVMKIVRPKWSRSVTLEAWTSGADKAFIRTLAPRKDKGVAFLKRGREAWNFVPAIDRVIKIPPSMMLQSWMGSDFSNDDVVRADSIVTDYDHKVVREENRSGRPCWVVEAIPRPDAPVVWGKLRFVVDQANYVAERIEYEDEDGLLVKYGEATDVSLVEGRELATTFVMHDVTRPGNRTTINYRRITFSPDIDEDTFTLKNLRRKR
jgi:outer membrane lipoprotein-sorting protein